MLNLIFLGAPGSGKGTQAASLVSEFHLAHISTGDILRKAVADGTALGLEARRFMDAGQLVPDDVIIGIIAERLRDEDCAQGFLLDGFPRTIVQAEALESILKQMGRDISKVVCLNVPEEELVKRLTSRGRSDDNEAVVRNRLKVYRDQTSPLIEWYTQRGLLHAVDGLGDLDTIASRIRAGLPAKAV